MKLVLTGLVLATVIGLTLFIPALRTALDRLPWEFVGIACLTIGLAPFTPPHLVEKIGMLVDGTLARPIDWFDMAMHGSPWVVLVAKGLGALLDRIG